VERRRYINLSLCLLFLVSCGTGGFEAPSHIALKTVEVEPESTYIPPTPQKNQAGDYEYYQGLSQVSNLKLSLDGPTHVTQLEGSMVLHPKDGGPALNLQFHLQGKIDSTYTSLMRPTDTQSLEQNQIELGAKLTCLYSDCSDSFVDIYVKHKGVIYHHQVEAEGNVVKSGPQPKKDPKKEPKKDPPAPAPKKDEPKADPKKQPEVTPQDPLQPDGSEEEFETETEDEHDDTAEGFYVGTRESDIENLFPEVKQEAEAKKNPKKDVTPKKGDPKRDTPAPKQDPKKDPKKDEPKKDDKTPGAPPPPPPPISSGSGLNYTGQAIGKPTKGRLVNGVDVYEYTQKNLNPGFRILYPEKKTSFGTSGMLAMLVDMGKYVKKSFDGYILTVNTITTKNGGLQKGHQSHQTGIDADIAYLFSKEDLQAKFTAAVVSGRPRQEWMVQEQWQMFKYLVKTGNIDRIFVDTAVKKTLCEYSSKAGELRDQQNSDAFQTLRRLSPEKSHINHFHMRLRQDCPSHEPRCFQMVEPKNSTNC
jgi:penicillin-insensitive murein endopeptidase